MRALISRLGTFYAKHAVAIDMMLITAGAAAVKRRIENVHERLDALEARGWAPLDDVATLGDLAKLEEPLRVHDEALWGAGLLVEQKIPVEVVDEAPEAPQEAEGPA